MTTDLDTAVTDFFRFWYSLKAIVGTGGLRVGLKNFANAGYEQNYPYQVRNMKASNA